MARVGNRSSFIPVNVARCMENQCGRLSLGLTNRRPSVSILMPTPMVQEVPEEEEEEEATLPLPSTTTTTTTA